MRASAVGPRHLAAHIAKPVDEAKSGREVEAAAQSITVHQCRQPAASCGRTSESSQSGVLSALTIGRKRRSKTVPRARAGAFGGHAGSPGEMDWGSGATD